MNQRDSRLYGAILLGSALLSLLAAMHHPSAASHDLASALRILADEAGMIAGIHGLLIALFLLELLGLYGFARSLDLARPLPAAGLILVGTGTMAMLGAAAINGFAVPAFASDLRGIAPADTRSAAMLLRMCWDVNQALASIGAVAWGAGLIAWSIDLARRTGMVRLTGLIGLAASVVMVGALATGLIRLHVTGFIIVTALISAWSVAVALLMLSGRLSESKVVPQPD
jgi:hypothetical protein